MHTYPFVESVCWFLEKAKSKVSVFAVRKPRQIAAVTARAENEITKALGMTGSIVQ